MSSAVSCSSRSNLSFITHNMPRFRLDGKAKVKAQIRYHGPAGLAATARHSIISES